MYVLAITVRNVNFLGDGGQGGQHGWVVTMYILGGVRSRNEC